MLNKKSKIRFLVDIMMFFLLFVNAGIGLVLKFALIKRSNIQSGIDQPPESGIIGLSRAGWLDLHWVISLLFIAAVLMHLILNFKTISHYCKQKLIPEIPAVYLISCINLILIMILIASLLINSDERQDKIHSEPIINKEIKPISKAYSTKYRNRNLHRKMKPEPAKKNQTD